MPDLTNVPGWAWPTGIGALVIAIKYFWPLMTQSVTTQLTQGRTESGLLSQALAEIEKSTARAERAEARADAADKRADEAFTALFEMKLEVQNMAWRTEQLSEQLQRAKEEITALTTQLQEFLGGSHV